METAGKFAGTPSRAISAMLVSAAMLFTVTACTASKSPELVDRNPDAGVSKYYQQTLAWMECGEDVFCTTVSAPLNWDEPEAATITLALARRPATGTKQGSLLVNPGGPGESGFALVSDSSDAVDATLQKSFDIVGFDPRGVGRSAAVTCYSPKEKDAYLYDITPGVLGSDEWIAAKGASARAYAQACATNTGPLIAHVDSVSAARDLDLMRAALGDKKLNYLGYSYGTFLGTTYAGLFPHRVGRLVFDGIDNPWSSAVSVDESGNDTSGKDSGSDDPFELALRAFMVSCLAGESKAVDSAHCAFSGTADGALAAVATMLTATSASPIRNADGRMLGGATLVSAVTNELYSLQSWPALNKMFLEVAAGNATTAFESADAANGRNSDGSYLSNSSDAFRAINCLDGTSNSDASQMKQQAAEIVKASPIFGPYQTYGSIECASWSVSPKSLMDPVTAQGADPILLIGTTNDPATPYADAQALAEQLANGHLVTFTGEGHTAYNSGSSCVDRAVDRYFLSGVVPQTDPQC